MPLNEMAGQVAVSIVSHGHGGMVNALIGQLQICPEVGQIIVTRNVPEATLFVADELVAIIENPSPKGFGANHNAAFQQCRLPFFCVLNPDIELLGNPFPALLDGIGGVAGVVAAPLILSPSGSVEDSARCFPTFLSLARKAFGGPDGRYALRPNQAPIAVDWVAGMFVLFASKNYARLGGFDERYFLYYEDVDICARAWRAGLKVMVVPSVSVVHDARRDSRKNVRHMRWHVTSMARYLLTSSARRA